MNDKCAWTEIAYRVPAYYASEPHRLRGKLKEVERKILHHAVPLTWLLHVLLRCSPPNMVRSLLKRFGLRDEVQLGALSLRMPPDTLYTQPDVCLESDTTRLFIEVKIGRNTTTLDQVQQYLLLHADEDTRNGVRTPYLLFLTKRGFPKSWKPCAQANGDVQDFLHGIVSDAPIGAELAALAGKKVMARCEAQYKAIAKEIVYGAATWQCIGDYIASGCEHYESADEPRRECPLLLDFVAELRRRKLMV